ncbi:malectin domain-containing carbohydrate-binding protein [Haladaptatus sp. NG-SE-30]
MSGTSSTASGGFVQGILIGGGVVFFVAGMIVLGGIPSDIISPSSGGADNGTNTVGTTTGSIQTSTSATQISKQKQTSKKATTKSTRTQTTQPSQTTQPAQTTKTTTSTRTTTTTARSQETVLYRVNVGGPRLSSSDGGPAWTRDTENSPSRFGNARMSGSRTNNTDEPITLTPAVPPETPRKVFRSWRWDADYETPSDDPEMHWQFPVESGTYEVRLYFAETYLTESGPNSNREKGPRIFDAQVEGETVLNDYNIYDELGHDRGTMKSYTVTVRDGELDVTFLHEQEDPQLQGIEIVLVEGGEQNDRSNEAVPGKDKGKKKGEDKRDDKWEDDRDDSRQGDDILLASRSGKVGI